MKLRSLVVLSILFAVLAAAPVQAQQHDLSAYNRFASDGFQSQPWYVYNGPVFVDARYNYDQLDTASVYVGKGFGNSAFKVYPNVGVLFGEYTGVSPQLTVGVNKGRVSAFSVTQYVFGARGNSDFVYHWADVLFSTKAKWLAVGFDEQFYRDQVPGAEGQFDIGPVVKFSFKRYYVKVWPTVSPTQTGTQKLFIITGVTF